MQVTAPYAWSSRRTLANATGHGGPSLPFHFISDRGCAVLQNDAMGQERTHASRQTASLDHFVGAAKHRKRHADPKRFGGLQIDDQLNLHCLLNRQVGGLVAFENTPGVDAGKPV
jgi:hypothetical protein